MKKLIEYFDKRLAKPEPKFLNKPNKLILGVDGKEYWISRSVAVVAVVLGIWKDNIFVIGEQRSEKMDEPGKYCVPCGYLDFNESGYEAVVRELYEEVKFYVPDYILNLMTNNEEQPFFVQTDPSENRQNVALTYCLIYDFEKIGLPELQKCDEVKKVEWIPIERVNNKEMYDWAFLHQDRIKLAVEKFKEYLI